MELGKQIHFRQTASGDRAKCSMFVFKTGGEAKNLPFFQ